MNPVGRFVVSTLVWAAGIFILMIVAGAAGSEPRTAAEAAGWLARALILAAYPAGVTIAPSILGDPAPARRAVLALVAAAGVGAIVVVLHAIIAPALGDQYHGLARLLRDMSDPAASWETRNDASWRFVSVGVAGANAVLYAAIGAQVGIWAGHAFAAPLRRTLYWLVGLALLVAGYSVTDTTYETVVLHTAADTRTLALLPMLFPLSLCLGLGLPTVALLRRRVLPRTPG